MEEVVFLLASNYGAWLCCAFLPCLVGGHAPMIFLSGPACEGHDPLFRSQLVMIWATGGCMLQ
jgi:hypothetical protein